MDSQSGSWTGPRPVDKYLPAWVIAAMVVAVWVLSALMMSGIKQICAMKDRCYAAGAIRDTSTVAELMAIAVKKEADDKAAEASAAAGEASTAPVPNAASQPNAK